MSIPKIHTNPLAKQKHNLHHKTKSSKGDKFAKQFSWVIILVFSVSTFTALGLIFNEIKGNVGLAAQDLAGYSTWKTQYGLNTSDVDANWNKAGDGISNYNKYLLGINPNNAVDGSVIASNVSGGAGSFVGRISPSTDPISNTIQENGPSLGANKTSTNSGTSPTSPTIRPNIPASTNPLTSDPTNQVPILGNPTPTAPSKTTSPSSSPSGTTVALNGSAGSTAGSTGSTSSGTPSLASTSGTSNSISSSGSANTVRTSGETTINTTNGENPSGTIKSSGTTPATVVAGKKTATDRTGGEFNLILFLTGLASLASGAYILKNKFTKNSLVVHQGEK